MSGCKDTALGVLNCNVDDKNNLRKDEEKANDLLIHK